MAHRETDALRPFRKVKTGVILCVRITPNASGNQIVGTRIRDGGTLQLRIHVTATPEKGRANKAMIALLAKSLHLPKSAFDITSGRAARSKNLSIKGKSEEISAAINRLLHNIKIN